MTSPERKKKSYFKYFFSTLLDLCKSDFLMVDENHSHVGM
jgi:hypothetical protein